MNSSKSMPLVNLGKAGKLWFLEQLKSNISEFASIIYVTEMKFGLNRPEIINSIKSTTLESEVRALFT